MVSGEHSPLMGMESAQCSKSKIGMSKGNVSFRKDGSSQEFKRNIYDEFEKCVVILIFSGFGVLAREGLTYISSKSMLTFQSRNSVYETSNMIGSFVIGFLSLIPEDIGHHLHLGLAVGFCGTLTTFTSFIWEAVTDETALTTTIHIGGAAVTVPERDQICRAGTTGLVLTNITTTMSLCIMSWLIGRWIAETLRNLRVHKHFVRNPAALLDDVLIDDDVVDDDDTTAKQSAINTSILKSNNKVLRGYLSFILFLLAFVGWCACFACTLVWPTWQIYNHVKFPSLPSIATQAERDAVQRDHDKATKYTYTLILAFAWVGAYLRYLISMWLNPKRNGFFWGTFVCNMLAVVVISS